MSSDPEGSCQQCEEHQAEIEQLDEIVNDLRGGNTMTIERRIASWIECPPPAYKRGWDVFEVDGRLEILKDDEFDVYADDREATIAAINDVANWEPGAAELVLSVLLQRAQMP